MILEVKLECNNIGGSHSFCWVMLPFYRHNLAQAGGKYLRYIYTILNGVNFWDKERGRDWNYLQIRLPCFIPGYIILVGYIHTISEN